MIIKVTESTDSPNHFRDESISANEFLNWFEIQSSDFHPIKIKRGTAKFF